MSERVLILDDESLIADLLGEIFRILGFEARVCYEPATALAALEEESFDLVLSDYRMPQMNGQRFYEALTELRPELAQRIIFLTGDVLSDETRAFIQRTGAPFLGKPFDMGKVQRVVRSVLDHSPLESRLAAA